MKVFNLPDLGEGLPDAEIVEWFVQEGDVLKVDQPMVSMETAKAVVDVPSPENGVVLKLHGQPGDVIETGAPLVTFGEAGENADAAAADEQTQDHTGQRSEPPAATPDDSDSEVQTASDTAASDEDHRPDTGTVVGAMESTDRVVSERLSSIGGVKVSPAVRALARKLKVDLTRIRPSGADDVVTAADVKQAAANPDLLAPQSAEAPAPDQASSVQQPQQSPASRPEPKPEPTPKPTPEPVTATAAKSKAPSGEWEPIRGTRRTMARIMSESHAKVVPTTLMDDADIHAWRPGQDITIRLIRSLWAGARIEPGLNAWYNGEDGVRMLHKGMDVGIAVDTADGLFVPALRNVHDASPEDVRAGLNRMRDNVKDRSIPPEDLKDYTIMLSNFGVFAGRYATPIINPPCVAIVAAGKLRHEATPVLGGFEVHRVIPLSLTFDHRACTGGEAARFLKAMLDDLALPN